jgi:hypothetical protein
MAHPRARLNVFGRGAVWRSPRCPRSRRGGRERPRGIRLGASGREGAQTPQHDGPIVPLGALMRRAG